MKDLCSSFPNILITPLKIIDVPGGAVMHAMKAGDSGFNKYGEAYFSNIESGAIKAWKRHTQMTMNLVVPCGAVRFVVYDDRFGSQTINRFQQVMLGADNYCRLTIPPMLWVGFQGVDKNTSTILNIADIVHVAGESDRKDIHELDFNWERV